MLEAMPAVCHCGSGADALLLVVGWSCVELLVHGALRLQPSHIHISKVVRALLHITPPQRTGFLTACKGRSQHSIVRVQRLCRGTSSTWFVSVPTPVSITPGMHMYGPI